MTLQNVAIVFGPTLLKPEMESANITAYMVFQNQIIEFILCEFEAIFHTWAPKKATPVVVQRIKDHGKLFVRIKKMSKEEIKKEKKKSAVILKISCSEPC